LDFLDLFLRTEVSSASRAQCFLWLCFNYLEAPSSEDDYDEDPVPNPFADQFKPTSPPTFTFLNTEEILKENQDSPEDIAMTEKLVNQRTRIVQTQGTKDSGKASNKASVNGSIFGDDEEPPAPVLPDVKKSTKSKRTAPAERRPRPETTKEKKSVVIREKQKEKDTITLLPDLDDDDDNLLDAFIKRQ
jgi:Ino eighty subunit 1